MSGGLRRAAAVLLAWSVILELLRLGFVRFRFVRLVPGVAGTMLAVVAVVQVLLAVALFSVSLVLAARFVRRRLLWSLRSKLLLTYLLVGLAPVVLFLTLALISAYIAAGQFAIHLADTRVQRELTRLENENRGFAHRIDGSDGGPAMRTGGGAGQELSGRPEQSSGALRPEQALYIDSTYVAVGGLSGPSAERSRARMPLGLPPWALRLAGERFRGMVVDGNDLHLVVIEQRDLADGRRLSLVSSLLVDAPLMSQIAEGLGRAGMIALLTGHSSAEGGAERPRSERGRRSTGAREGAENRARMRRTSVFGGTEPKKVSLADVRVRFLSTLPATDWDTGEVDNVPIEVISRPSLLYRQLFGGSLSGVVTSVIRIGLIVLSIVFALIEALALWLARRLSRTVTASVTDLYKATQSIDRGDLSYRIAVDRKDQLADLSRSFNAMTGSLQRLLEEQKEKERLQNELTIAQEVQANLFPQNSCDLPSLLLHGVCRPARSVSGDYYDFLQFRERSDDGEAMGRQTGLGIALGDISGKGISAALLMATLHSAVRAYRFASEELMFSASEGGGEDRAGCDELFKSPGRILSLVNRHLYRSTQPEKYATLFLAHYDLDTAQLTYSNAGQLPPLVLGRDGSVRRLDKGGTVVGLLDGMHYDEDCVQLWPGDIVVAYSDGVTEPENDFGDFGEERLMEVVKRYRGEPLSTISNEVMRALDAWIGAEEQPDDITLVLARQM